MIWAKFREIIFYNKEKYECILDDPMSKLGVFLDQIILRLVLFCPKFLKKN